MFTALCNAIFILLFVQLAISLHFHSDYDPIRSWCPSSPLVRAAAGLSSQETDYINARKPLADEALVKWLQKTSPQFPTTGKLPTLGLASSGGAYRAMLVGAGIVQGLDSRDSDNGTSGLFQALSYHAGLSGGAWLLASLASSDYRTVSNLKETLWRKALDDTIFHPGHLLDYPALLNDLAAKEEKFSIRFVDIWGRLLSHQLLHERDGGDSQTLSNITSKPSFIAHKVPYPIITAVGVRPRKGECSPSLNGTQYEFHPYESGSWDHGVGAFSQTAFLGSSLTNGQPVERGQCIKNYDILSFILATSSNFFNRECAGSPFSVDMPGYKKKVMSLLTKIHKLAFEDGFAVYPNPFYEFPEAPLVSSDPNLYLVDGGETLQINPIWPFIQPARGLDVLLVNDNSGDTQDNFPNGTQILNTYNQAQAAGLKKMPFIPSATEFVSKGLNKRPTFFGCSSPETVTIVYLPNAKYNFASNTKTDKLQYSTAETEAMIANGLQVITKGGDSEWPLCLGCAIMKKTGETLPEACASCFRTYCYEQ